MRFTTSSWPPVTNVFIVSAVALLSLISAANANPIDFVLVSPAFGEVHQPGERNVVSWYVEGIDLADADLELSGQLGNLLMVGNDNGYSYSLLNNVPILNMFAMVTYPAVINDSISYYISLQTEYGTFTSDPFTMKDAD